MANEEIIMLIKNGMDPAGNMLALYENMRGMIFKLAKRYRHYAELEDLTQEGYIALCMAVEKYEPGKCVFSTYVYSCIRWHMLRYVQENSGYPAYMWQYVKEYNRLCEAFSKEYNRNPSADEVSYYLQVGRNMALAVINTAKAEHTASLDSPLNSTEEEITLADTLVGETDIETETLEKVHQERLKKVLWEAVDSLPSDQPDMIRKRYIDNMTLKDIGVVYRTGIEVARQGINKGLRTLRTSKRRLLSPFLDEYIDSNAYHGNGVERFNHTWTSSTERVALELVEMDEAPDGKPHKTLH